PDHAIARACGVLDSEPDDEIRRAAARSYTRLIARYGPVPLPEPPPERSARPPGAVRRLGATIAGFVRPRWTALTGRLKGPLSAQAQWLRRELPTLAPLVAPRIRALWSSLVVAARTLLDFLADLGRSVMRPDRLLAAVIRSLRTRGATGTIRHVLQ